MGIVFFLFIGIKKNELIKNITIITIAIKLFVRWVTKIVPLQPSTELENLSGGNYM